MVLAACDPTLARLPGLANLPPPPELPGEAARRRVLEALGTAMSAFAADRPLLLLVDDLQWADDLSVGFLQTAAPAFWRDNAILIVAALRSEELTPETRALLDMPHVERMTVSHLESGAIRVMVEDMLGDVRPPASLTEFLEAQSSGNPFFVAEYLRAALEAGVLFRDGRGRWNTAETVQGIRALSLPGSLRELIMRRVQGLAEGTRRLLELGAVLGREVDVDALWAVAADPEQSAGTELAFFDALADLQKREILAESGPGRLRFVHDKLREVSYEGIAREARTDLHRRIARELERHFDPGASPAEAPAVLAHHFEQAGDLARAVEYLDLAGERALAGYANKEGARLLEQARKLEAASGVRRDVLTRARRARLARRVALGAGGQRHRARVSAGGGGVARVPLSRVDRRCRRARGRRARARAGAAFVGGRADAGDRRRSSARAGGGARLQEPAQRPLLGQRQHVTDPVRGFDQPVDRRATGATRRAGPGVRRHAHHGGVRAHPCPREILRRAGPAAGPGGNRPGRRDLGVRQHRRLQYRDLLVVRGAGRVRARPADSQADRVSPALGRRHRRKRHGAVSDGRPRAVATGVSGAAGLGRAGRRAEPGLGARRAGADPQPARAA